jgi:hypothetical protein
VNPFNKICFNFAKCINNARSQPCKRLSKINNVDAYQILARQKGKMTFKNKVEPQNFQAFKMEQSFNPKLE